MSNEHQNVRFRPIFKVIWAKHVITANCKIYRLFGQKVQAKSTRNILVYLPKLWTGITYTAANVNNILNLWLPFFKFMILCICTNTLRTINGGIINNNHPSLETESGAICLLFTKVRCSQSVSRSKHSLYISWIHSSGTKCIFCVLFLSTFNTFHGTSTDVPKPTQIAFFRNRSKLPILV